MIGTDLAADLARRFAVPSHGNVTDPPPPVTFVTFGNLSKQGGASLEACR